ncbi:MAG: histone deacetylase family protein [Acidobacteriota bacterium]|nr:histone deacetylase family protein [Acidobacteriota bacterium]
MRAFYHPRQSLHDPQQFMRYGRMVPAKDLPARVDALLGAVRAMGAEPEAPKSDHADARLAVHTAGFLAFLEGAWGRWRTLPDHGPEVWPNTFPYWSGRPEDRARPDCPAESIVARTGWYLGDLSVALGPNSWESIRESCNTAVAAADTLIETTHSAAEPQFSSPKPPTFAKATVGRQAPSMIYALCRPSGHHARADRASGFCFVNNTAVAAQRLRSTFNRVAILDVDAHHGDGTQQIFYSRADVLTVSIHADPKNYYPFFTGYTGETGIGGGEGFNLNLPLAHGSTGTAMMAAVDTACDRIQQFGPDGLVVALGFDAHARDPIGVLKLEADDFGTIGRRVRELRLPTLVVQEGGYAIDVLGDCLTAFFRA